MILFIQSFIYLFIYLLIFIFYYELLVIALCIYLFILSCYISFIYGYSGDYLQIQTECNLLCYQKIYLCKRFMLSVTSGDPVLWSDILINTIFSNVVVNQ